MAITADQYRALWRQVRIEGNKRAAGTALKAEMGNTTNPKQLAGVIAGGLAALKFSVPTWANSIELTASTLLDISTALHAAQAGWATAMDGYLKVDGGAFLKELTGRVGRNALGSLTPAEIVERYRVEVIATIGTTIKAAGAPAAAATLGEAAVLAAYGEMYQARERATFKSVWSSTDTDLHLGGVWASILSLRLSAPDEQARLDWIAKEERRQEEERRRFLEESAREERLSKKRLMPEQTVRDNDLPLDRQYKKTINETCTELVEQYPADVASYDEAAVSRAVAAAKDHVTSEYGMQMSANLSYVKNKIDEVVETARKKKYPLENGVFVRRLTEIAIAAYYLGISGSDDADKKQKGGVELRR